MRACAYLYITLQLDRGYTLQPVATANDFSRMSGEAVLANIPLFKPLSPEEIRTISIFLDKKEIRKGKTVFAQGEPVR